MDMYGPSYGQRGQVGKPTAERYQQQLKQQVTNFDLCTSAVHCCRPTFIPLLCVSPSPPKLCLLREGKISVAVFITSLEYVTA